MQWSASTSVEAIKYSLILFPGKKKKKRKERNKTTCENHSTRLFVVYRRIPVVAADWEASTVVARSAVHSCRQPAVSAFFFLNKITTVNVGLSQTI